MKHTELSPLSFESFESLLSVARAVRDLSAGCGTDEKLAVAWTLRNRLARQPRAERADGRAPALPLMGRGEGAHDLASPEMAEAIELVTAVWLGLIPDPTNGATACHRHDLNPHWSKFKSVKALIGQQLFYS
jgi:hypothetical protein